MGFEKREEEVMIRLATQDWERPNSFPLVQPELPAAVSVVAMQWLG